MCTDNFNAIEFSQDPTGIGIELQTEGDRLIIDASKGALKI
jgi:hypothetical protein